MTMRVDCVVIGAGVVGLAVARALAETGRETVVLEAADAIGTETSSRNSEVIHAGLYYAPGSLKARLCVAGKGALYAYCGARGIDARPIGKLLVAAIDAERPKLHAIAETAARNGVHDLVRLDGDAVRDMEPEVRCVAALLSPSSGILDSHALMLALQGDIERAGGAIAFHSPVLGGEARPSGVVLRVGGAEPMELEAGLVVNAAGLHASVVARAIDGLPAAAVPATRYAKGSYFALTGVKPPFRRLVYPMPQAGGLGVHATLDLGGQIRFGPDVEWVDAIDYAVDPSRSEPFAAAIRRYWPGLPDGALQPAYAGIRPKIDGANAADFQIQGPETHGVAGLWNLFGVESPGLTAALAIGAYVRDAAEAASR